MLALSTPFVLYWYVLFKYSLNIPFLSDDYSAVLRFLNRFVLASGFHEKSGLLFEQYGEHRIFFNRIVELAQYKIYGRVNFIQLIILGNIGWALSVYVIFREFRDSGLKIGYFIPVMFITFNFVRWDQITWAMSSIQSYYGIFFPLASLYVLTKRPGPAGLACSLFLVAISIFTSGSGFILAPIVLLVLVSRKRYSELLVSFMVLALLFGVYFYFLNYVKPSFTPPIKGNPWRLALYSLANLGNTFMGTYMQFEMGKSLVNSNNLNPGYNIMKSVYEAAISGMLFVISFAYLGVKGLYKRNGGFIFWSVVWIILIGLELAVGRSGNGYQTALISRYSVFSALLLSFLYIAGMDFLKENKKALKKFAVVCSIFSILLYMVTSPMGLWLIKWRYNVLENRPFIYASPADIQTLVESEKLGIYQMPAGQQ